MFLGWVLLMIVSAQPAFAQSQSKIEEEEEEEDQRTFKKENLFVGGTVNLGFGNNVTQLGIGPFIGYSLTNYLDVAFAPNISYISQRDNFVLDDKLRQTIYGPGTFVRLFPVKFLFAQVQYEFNLIRNKYIYPESFNLPDVKDKLDAHSLLVGAGYAGGRDKFNKSFYYISIMWDVADSRNSPYKDNQNRNVPIIRAGYNIALFQGRRGL